METSPESKGQGHTMTRNVQGVSLKISISNCMLKVHETFETHDCARASTRNISTFMFWAMVPTFDVQTASEEGTK